MKKMGWEKLRSENTGRERQDWRRREVRTLEGRR